jgi:hypothetical protein
MDDLEITELFVNSTGGVCTVDFNEKEKPFVVRGVIKKDQIHNCAKEGRDYYYIDTGYFGNFPSIGNSSGKKIWHRIVKNSAQHNIVKTVPDDRWKNLLKQDSRLAWKGWKNYDKKILLVMPNPKACKFYNVDYDTWVKETEEKIKKHIDLPIEVRIKGSRSERNNGYTIYNAFDSGVYATVAFNSIAALESVMYGIPAFVSVPCAASPLSSDDLSKLKNPFRPDQDLIQKQCMNLSYGQFTMNEISNGTAWKILQRY